MSKLRFDRHQLAMLIDPDKTPVSSLEQVNNHIQNHGIDLILIGGSLLFNSLDEHIKELKKTTHKPVYIFPGSIFQISNEADGLLFLSLLSGRNPEYLIGQQVLAAPILKRSMLDVVSVAYLLIDGGKTSSVQYMSNTIPIPADKIDIILATCYAAEFIGFKAIYLEAGSGAINPVPLSVVEAVSKSVKLPIIVGGGIKSKTMVEQYFSYGAQMVVVGTAFEDNTFGVIV